MVLLKKSDKSKLDFELRNHFVYPQRLATIFGYGSISPSRAGVFKILYALYSILAICILVYEFARLMKELKWHEKWDMEKAANVVTVVWTVQSIWSALFFIYTCRRGKFRELKRVWIECGADELIAYSNFAHVQWRWFGPVIVFCLFLLVEEIAAMLLEFYGLALESANHLHDPSIRPWEIYILLPASIMCVISSSAVLYAFYIVCTSLSYAWLGFAAKIETLSNTKGFQFGDETMRFVGDTHNQLCQLTHCVSQVFGPYAFVMIVLAIPDLFLQLYFTSQLPADIVLKIQTISGCIISFSALVILFSPCMVHTASTKIADTFYQHYYGQWKKRVGCDDEIPLKTLSETQILLTKLYNSSAHVTACGWFGVSKDTLGVIVSILITAYYVVILGAAPPEKTCPGDNATLAVTNNATSNPIVSS